MGTRVVTGWHSEWKLVAVKQLANSEKVMEHTAQKEYQMLINLACATGPGSDNIVK